MMRYLFLLLFLLSTASTQANPEDTLKVAYTSAPPFIMANEANLDGVSVWLWEHCAKELKLNFQLIPMEFPAMLEALHTGEVDVSINPLTITADRMNHMHFTHPFYASHSILVTKHYSFFERIFHLIKSLFSISFLSGFLVLLMLIAIFGFLMWFFERRANPDVFRKGYKGFWDGLWWSVVTLTTVGYGDKTPKSRGGKIVALVWMFSGLLFISGLTASVASSLTVDRLSTQASDLDDLKDHMIGTVRHSSSADYLKNDFFRKVQLYSNVSKGLDAMLDHKIEAFFYDEPILNYRLLNDKKYQDLILSPKKYDVQFYAFALPLKHQDLKNQLSKKLIEIRERGKWQEVLREYNCGIE